MAADDFAFNEQTGEAVRLEKGQWVPVEVAHNPETGERVYYDGSDWQPFPSQGQVSSVDPTLNPAMPEAPQRAQGGGSLSVAQANQSAGNPGSLVRGAQAGLQGTLDQLPAAAQRTSPVVRSADGEFVRPFLGEVVQADFGPALRMDDGTLRILNPQNTVVLRDPQTNKMLAFEEADEDRENRLVALGRVLGVGAVTGAPSRIAAASRGARQGAQQAGRAIEQAPAVGRRTMQSIGTGAGAQQADDAARVTLETFDAAKVDPTSVALTGNRQLQQAQGAAGSVPIVSGPVERAANRAATQGMASRNQVASAFGQASTVESVGDIVDEGLRRYQSASLADTGRTASEALRTPSRFTSLAAKTEAAYDKVARRIPEGAQVDLTEFKAALDEALGPTGVQQLDTILADPGLSGLAGRVSELEQVPWQAARRLRTFIRTELKKAGQQAGRTLQQSEIEGVYQALTDDIARSTEQVAGKGAATQLRRADRLYATGRRRIEGTLNRFLGIDARNNPVARGRIFNRLFNAARDNASTTDQKTLAAIKGSLRPEEWDEVASFFVRNMGQRGDDFSIAGFATDWGKLSGDAKGLLFAGKPEAKQQLEALAKAMDAFKGADRFRNNSNTANAVLTALAIGNLDAVMTGGAGTVSVVGGRLTAEMLMSPKVARWATQSLRLITRGSDRLFESRRWAAHVNQLRQVAAQEPVLGAALRELADVATATAEPEPTATSQPPQQ